MPTPAALLSCICFVVVACGDGSAPTTPGGTTPPDAASRVRVVHAAPRAPTLDVFVDNVLREGRVVYGSASPYLNVPPGVPAVAVRAILTGEPIASGPTAVNASSDVTVLAIGIYPANTLFALRDSNAAAAGDSARVRIVDAAPNGGAFDVYVTEPGASLDGRAPVLTGFVYTAVSEYLTLPAGAWRIAATLPGTATLVLDTGEQRLQPGEVRTAVILDDSKGNRARGILLFTDRAARAQAQRRE